MYRVCCVCVFFPFILDIKFVRCTSRGRTGGRSHRTSHPPSFCGACLYFSREKYSAVLFPRRPRSRILCTDDLIVLGLLLGILFVFSFFSEEKSQLPRFELSSQRVERRQGYQLSYRGDRRTRVLIVGLLPVARVVQLVTSKPSEVRTSIRISVSASHEMGFFPSLSKKKMPNK